MSVHSQGVSKRTIWYAAIGTALEWYDFSIFIYVTPFLAPLFFPREDRIVAIMSTFGIFAAGYFMRPIGGIFFGNLGDKIGRKKVLILSVILMSIPMIVISVLPTYHTIGIWAVVILLLMRMVQGFSVGGEYTGVLVMLLEQSEPKNRGFITSFGTFVSGSGVLLSSIVVLILTVTLSNAQMLAFGWRIPFIIGIFLAIYSLIMQKNMEESPHFTKLKEEKHLAKFPAWEALKRYPGRILIAFFLTGYLGVAYYMVSAFMPTYLKSILMMNPSTVMVVTTIVAAVYAFSAPLWGKCSDKIGRKKQMIGASIAFIILGYPMFWLLLHSGGNLFIILIAELALIIPVTAFTAAFVSAVNELFPTKERFSGAAIGYNVGNALFGATSPIIFTYLIEATGNKLSPSYYFIGGAIFIIFVILCMKETAGTELVEE